MGKIFLGLGLIASLSGLSSQTSWDPAKTNILMVGILEWEDTHIPSFPQEGRQDRVLRDLFYLKGVPVSQLTYLEDKAATRSAILKELTYLARNTDKNGTLIFYFAGHGSRQFIGNHILPYDVDETHFQKTAISIPEIRQILEENFRGRTVILLGDFCYSGSLVRRVIRDLQKNAPFQVLALASANEYSSSTSSWSFTESIIEIFSGSPNVDTDSDGDITLTESAGYIERTMRTELWDPQLSESGQTRNLDPTTFVLSNSSPIPSLRIGLFQMRDIAEARIDDNWEIVRPLFYQKGYYLVRLLDGETAFINEKSVRPIDLTSEFPIGSTAYLKGLPYPVRILRVQHEFRLIEYTGRAPDWIPVWGLHKEKQVEGGEWELPF